MAQISLKVYLFNNDIRRFQIADTTTFDEFKSSIAKLTGKHQDAINEVSILFLDNEHDWCTVSSDFEWKEAVRLSKQAVLRLKVVQKQQPQQEKKCPRAEWWAKKRGGSCHQQRNQQGFQGCEGSPFFAQLAQQFLPQVLNVVQDVAKAAEQEQKKQEKPQKQDEQVIHRHIVCDGCEEHGIVGVRYKCTQCPDYDLCSQCYQARAEIHDPSHTFTSIERPVRGHHHHRHEFKGFHPWFVALQQQQAQQAQNQQTKPAAEKVPEKKVQEVAPKKEEKAPEPVKQPVADKFIDLSKVAPSAPPAPVVEQAVKVNPYAAQIQTLEAMGFSNQDNKLEILLRKYNGNIQKVIEELFQ